MCVSLLPFSTSFLNAFRQTQVAPLLLGANLTSIGWLLYLQWLYASAQPEMVAECVTPEYRTLVRARFLMIPNCRDADDARVFLECQYLAGCVRCAAAVLYDSRQVRPALGIQRCTCCSRQR